jgi:hypothetical protein
MNTRTGQIYDSRDDATDDAVVPVTVRMVAGIETVRIDSGPFRGRTYEVVDGRRGRRRKDLE